MLIATQGKNVAATRQYFESVLTQGDYYLGQEVAGQWHGRGADVLGLGVGSNVTRDQFAALLAGQHPETGKALTQRQRKDRRPGVDLTFSVPKSVSLAWAINGDERIVEALRAAVHETMTKDIEPLMMRRVRDGGRAVTKDRTPTGKLIYADFLHKTSRPVEGRPDPHLHVHAFVINWTEQNGKHYAGEFEEIMRQRPSLQAKFEARLARTLEQQLGYRIEKTLYRQSGRMKMGWEIAGIDRNTIEKFSRRTEQVETFARENGITDAAEKGALGKKTREKKDRGTSFDQLRHEWRSRLTDEERGTFGGLTGGPASLQKTNEHELAEKALRFALDHHLYRQSTVERHQVIGTALEHAVTLSPEQVEAAIDRMNVIQKERETDGAKRHLVTTREVLAAEKELIAFAREGRGTRKAIGTQEHEFRRQWLNDQQKSAVLHVLTSRDAVMAITGGAGTGKSSLMAEAAEAIRGHGKEVLTLAPSTGAREVLQDKGFANAQTVEHLLRNAQLQSAIKGQVLWVDEAGLLDVRSMNALFRVAKEQNARIVLSGDSRQHASPRRGEALRLLEREAGLKIARVETIQRQKGQYQRAVALISRGYEIVDARKGTTGLVAGFDLLDRLGKIREIRSVDRHALLAAQYLKAEAQGRSTLVVAPTHQEAESVTAEIRSGLRRRGLLTEQEHCVPQLRSLNLSDAEKRETTTYAGQAEWIVQFHQNAKGGIKRGERYRVTGVRDGQVHLAADNGQQRILPQNAPERFEVYRESTLAVSVGDKVRFSLGGTAKDGKRRISNGRLDEVQAIDPKGHLVLKSGLTVDRNYGHLDLGYVITSHASQGKDRQVALAAMGSESLPAINAKQFYVTVSRGSDDVAIFVDDKAKIRQAIARSGEQLSATEMVREEHAEQAAASVRAFARSSGRRVLQTVRDRVAAWWKDRSSGEVARMETGRQRDDGGGPFDGFGPVPGLSGGY